MGIQLMVFAAIFIAVSNLCMRRSIDAGGTSKAYLMIQLYLSFFVTSDWFKEKFETAKASIFRREIARPQATMSRLQSRKAEIERDIESRRATVKFEPDSDKKISGKKKLEEVLASEIEKTPALPPKINRDKLDVEQEHSYTSRLLDAKRRVQQERDRHKNPDDKG